MNIEQEIRAQIEKNKGLKLAVGEINNHLSILEGLLRNERDDVQKQVNEAYQRGFEESIHKGCDGCQFEGTEIYLRPCSACRNAYPNQWTAKKQDDEIKVGDEVRWGMDLIVITRLYTNGGFRWCDGISKDGIAFHVLEENVSKTNRHFDIDKILGEMNE